MQKFSGSKLVIMAEVEEFDLGAVFEPPCRIVRYHAADRRLGGQDALSVRAHAVILSEPDTPNDIDIRVVRAHFFQRLIAHAGRVHIERAQIFHHWQNAADQRAVVTHFNVAEIQLLGVQVCLLAVQRYGAVDRHVGIVLCKRGNIVQRERAAELHA